MKAIGRNPQTKTDERWHEIITDQFDKRFPGYCGSNTDERPEKLADEEAQHLAWLADKTGTAPRTPLVTMGQYMHAFVDWAENEMERQGARARQDAARHDSQRSLQRQAAY